MNTTPKNYIVRSIDDLGRIVIPKEIRKTHNILTGDAFEITPTENGILLVPHKDNSNIEDEIKRLKSVIEEHFTADCNADRRKQTYMISQLESLICVLNNSTEPEEKPEECEDI